MTLFKLTCRQPTKVRASGGCILIWVTDKSNRGLVLLAEILLIVSSRSFEGASPLLQYELEITNRLLTSDEISYYDKRPSLGLNRCLGLFSTHFPSNSSRPGFSYTSWGPPPRTGPCSLCTRSISSQWLTYPVELAAHPDFDEATHQSRKTLCDVCYQRFHMRIKDGKRMSLGGHSN